MRRKRWAFAAVLLLALAAGFFFWPKSGDTGPRVESAAADASAPPLSSAANPPKTSPPAIARERPAAPAGMAAADAGAVSEEQAGPADAAAPGSTASAGPAAAWAVVGTAAAIEGEVQLSGPAPAAGKLHREADPFCARKEMTDPTVLAKDGKLANVWVHIAKGAPDAAPPAETAAIDQRDCMYTPRMVTAVVGQKIVVRNSDPVLHNVHAYLGASTVLNKGMPNDKAPPVELVAQQEGVLKWKCDVHPWMRGYVGVSRNGLQAVTGESGAFRISPVPPGTYTLAAWHEKYGEKSLQ